jgi:hypothetical protein
VCISLHDVQTCLHWSWSSFGPTVVGPKHMLHSAIMDTTCRDDEAGDYQAGFKLVCSRITGAFISSCSVPPQLISKLLPTTPFCDLLLPSSHSNMAPFSQMRGTPSPKCVSSSPYCAVPPAPSIPHPPV